MEKNKASKDSIKILNRRSFIITAISLIFSFIVSIIVVWKHRSNINRILKGEEPKIINKNS